MKKLLALAFFVASSACLAEGEVPRHQFTSAIDQREPTDALTDAMNINPMYYFTELRDLEGTVVTHRWSYNGDVMAEVEFNVGGPRWRVYSSKRFQPQWDGFWTVDVIDAAGNVLASDSIRIAND